MHSKLLSGPGDAWTNENPQTWLGEHFAGHLAWCLARGRSSTGISDSARWCPSAWSTPSGPSRQRCSPHPPVLLPLFNRCSRARPPATHGLSQGGPAPPSRPQEGSRTLGHLRFLGHCLPLTRAGKEWRRPSHALEKRKCWARGICSPTGGCGVQGTRLETSRTGHRCGGNGCHTECSCRTRKMGMLNP